MDSRLFIPFEEYSAASNGWVNIWGWVLDPQNNLIWSKYRVLFENGQQIDINPDINPQKNVYVVNSSHPDFLDGIDVKWTNMSPLGVPTPNLFPNT